MRNSARRPWTAGDIVIRLVIVLLASLVLLALQVAGYLQPIKGGITQLTSPAQLSATSFSETAADFVDFVLEFGTLRQRVTELEDQNASLAAEIADKAELERENQQLRQLFGFRQARPGLELRGAQVVARVIGQESTNFLGFITVDLGTAQGIRVGMPVVTPQGLVGRINEVRESTSDVLLIQNVNSFVSVILQSSRLQGVINGLPNGDLIVDFIQQGPPFSRGELVLTSGYGGSFPKGIPVGTVVQITPSDINVLQQAVLEPAVDPDRLELVAIVTNFDPQEELIDSLSPSVVPTPTGAPLATPPSEGGQP